MTVRNAGKKALGDPIQVLLTDLAKRRHVKQRLRVARGAPFVAVAAARLNPSTGEFRVQNHAKHSSTASQAAVTASSCATRRRNSSARFAYRTSFNKHSNSAAAEFAL